MTDRASTRAQDMQTGLEQKIFATAAAAAAAAVSAVAEVLKP